MLTITSAWAVVPDENATKDSLDVVINPAPDIYRLPAGKKIYHGTYNDWKFGPDARSKPTWFGADRETSAAMGYFQWCRELNQVIGAQERGSLSSTSGDFNVLNMKLTPKVMEVITKKDLNFLFIPYGGYGHKAAFSKIDYAQELSLYGAGSAKGAAAFDESGVCTKSIGVAGQTILPKAQWAAATDHMILQGWRAPWDQNEIAVCPAAATSADLENVGVETLSLDPNDPKAGVPAPLSQAYADVVATMGAIAENDDKAFKTAFLKAFGETANAGVFGQFFTELKKAQAAACLRDSQLKTRDVVGGKGPGGSNWFDIRFKKKNEPSTTDETGTADVPAKVGPDD